MQIVDFRFGNSQSNGKKCICTSIYNHKSAILNLTEAGLEEQGFQVEDPATSALRQSTIDADILA